MSFRATVSTRTQFAVETTAGTLPGSPSWKRLPNMKLMLHPEADVIEYIGQGYKVPSAAVMSKQWTVLSYEGPITYSELLYVLAGAFVKPSAPSVVDTSAQHWTFAPSLSNPDVPQTLSLQHGDDTNGGWLATYGLFDAITFEFSRSAGKVSGSGIGQVWQTNITTGGSPAFGALGSVTEIENTPVSPSNVSVFMDSTFGSLGTTQLTGDFSIKIAMTDRWKPVWTLDGTLASFAAHVEVPPKMTVSLELNADSVSDGLMTTLTTTGTKYIQVKATSPNLAGSVSQHYQLLLSFPFQVTKPGELKDLEGVYVQDWEGTPISSATVGYPYKAELFNKVATL